MAIPRFANEPNPRGDPHGSELAEEQLRPWREQIRELATRITPEQRSAWSRDKTRRLETLQDPDNRAQWRQGVLRARQTRRARIAAGHQERPQGFQAGSAVTQAAAARGRARRQELWPTRRTARSWAAGCVRPGPPASR